MLNMVRVKLSETLNKALRKYSESIRKDVIELLDKLVMGKIKAIPLRGKLSRFAALRISRELFVVVRYVPEQKYVVAYAIARRESLVKELEELAGKETRA